MKTGEPPHFKKQSMILLIHKAVILVYKSRNLNTSHGIEAGVTLWQARVLLTKKLSNNWKQSI